MGDEGDYWRDRREFVNEQRDKRRGKRHEAEHKLQVSGIPYKVFSVDHYRVDDKYDWWPSTGYWKSLDGKKTGYNIGPLIKVIRGGQALDAIKSSIPNGNKPDKRGQQHG